MSLIEQDTRFIINNNLVNKGWILDISNPSKNVFFESDILRIFENTKLKNSKKRPDYVLFDNEKNTPIGVIEAKSGGKNLDSALDQAMEYADMLNAPLVFAMNNGFCQTKHLHTGKPLFIDENEVTEIISIKNAKEFISQNTDSIYITPKEVLLSRNELINIFKLLNNTLRGEGLRAGIERLSEFANILFLKLYTENKDPTLWSSIKNTHGNLLIPTIDSILSKIEQKYDASVFTQLQTKSTKTIADVINKLDKLKLSSIDTDIKGDAFEYFLQQATATNNDLGEYFTPRHITRTIVHMVNPRFNETIYDPFCGTGGFLTEAFEHIRKNTLIKTNEDQIKLSHQTVFGREITSNAKLAKMNMILHGDGHNGIEKIDSLSSPVSNQYDIVITNMPFSQKTNYSYLYENSLAKNNGDGVCVLHCFNAVKKGGKVALVVPEGFLYRDDLMAVRKYILDNAKLSVVVSLPKEVFLPYAKVKTNILYLTNCKEHSKYDYEIAYYEVHNDGYSLDNVRKKITENDLKYLEFVDLNAKSIDKLFMKTLGFDFVDSRVIKNNDYKFNYANYATAGITSKFDTIMLKEILEISGKEKVKNATPPVMSITMEHGLINQSEKFKKRVASQDISKYKKVFRNELVVGFPIDEGVLGFQKIYDVAAVSPAYKIWKIKENADVNIEYLDYLLRSDSMRKIYKAKMQGSVERRRVIPDDVFLNISIPIPPEKIQKQLVCEFKKAEEIEKSLQKAIFNAKASINNLWD
ncbi:N-6 DNA methylase [Proteus terrae]|uniref:N-6 DNA methylase n=1 Tax=Proteus terrae TaxID=1574161 RepID=UPI0022468D0E|nr:N-6 DNA methylase [Proteus terrae]MCW9687987.1 N-6 DNA methylase [Proteus terrae]